MYSGLFSFAVLIIGAQADGYGDVGACTDIVTDDTFDFNDIYPLMYVHSVTKIPGSEVIDGIVVQITKDEYNDDYNELMYKNFETHFTNGSVTNLTYQDVPIGSAYALEIKYDYDAYSTLDYVLNVIGHLTECGVIVFYRCSDSGTLPQNVTQVFKKDNAPLSDACEAKIEAIIEDKLDNVAPSYVLPYALKNYS